MECKQTAENHQSFYQHIYSISRSSIEEILHHERSFHKNMNLGVVCLSNQLDNDKYTMWTLETFQKPYPDKPIAQKFGYPSLAVLG